jgi:hypothetical protein
MKAVAIVIITSVFALTACVRSSVLPMSNDTIQISTRAAPVCHGEAAQRLALRRAAIETINRGFDRFVVLNAALSPEFAGYLPGSATTNAYATGTAYGNTASVYGTSTTTYSPPTPMIAHTQSLVVKMFRETDPGASDAISARGILGPGWVKAVQEDSTTTC